MQYRQPFKNDWPITQKYGEKITSSFHTGIDYALPEKTDVLASEAGTVMFADMDMSGYGNTVILKHADGNATLYAHLHSINCLRFGDNVDRGQILGLSGNTGNSTGPHLHFEARKIWSDYKSHFDPVLLPLHTVFDPVEVHLKEPDELGNSVRIACPLGAWAHDFSFENKKIVPQGTKFTFTGLTTVHNGITYCECVPVSNTCWIAVHDGDTQILE